MKLQCCCNPFGKYEKGAGVLLWSVLPVAISLDWTHQHLQAILFSNKKIFLKRIRGQPGDNTTVPPLMRNKGCTLHAAAYLGEINCNLLKPTITTAFKTHPLQLLFYSIYFSFLLHSVPFQSFLSALTISMCCIFCLATAAQRLSYWRTAVCQGFYQRFHWLGTERHNIPSLPPSLEAHINRAKHGSSLCASDYWSEVIGKCLLIFRVHSLWLTTLKHVISWMCFSVGI